MKNSSIGDQVIHVVLEEIFRASEIDPSEVWPDNHFHELGLTPQVIQTVLAKSAASLGLDLSYQGESPHTPRQMVNLLKSMRPPRAS